MAAWEPSPFTSAELAELRARHEQGRAFGTSLGTELRLLATLDAVTAQRDRFVEVLVDMRKKGVIVLDRAKWERYLPDDDDGRWVAYVPFAPLLPAEVDAHYAAHPEARERDEAHARELLAQLQDERRG